MSTSFALFVYIAWLLLGMGVVLGEYGSKKRSASNALTILIFGLFQIYLILVIGKIL